MARHDDSAGSAGALLAGITIGALIGAGVALLLAPQAGEDTRGPGVTRPPTAGTMPRIGPGAKFGAGAANCASAWTKASTR